MEVYRVVRVMERPRGEGESKNFLLKESKKLQIKSTLYFDFRDRCVIHLLSLRCCCFFVVAKIGKNGIK